MLFITNIFLIITPLQAVKVKMLFKSLSLCSASVKMNVNSLRLINNFNNNVIN